MTNHIPLEKISGSLFGLALGDALAAPVEFSSDAAICDAILREMGNAPQGYPALVTDDTQMALAVGEALAMATQPYTPETVEAALRREFIRWMRSPENNRAPGATCMSACRGLEKGLPWQQATRINSKGCGANMRVAPVAFLPDIDATTRAAIAQFQAALTHGHPTALAASDLTAYAITAFAEGTPPGQILPQLTEYAQSQRRIYHHEWLSDLWKQGGTFASPEDYIEQGWNECFGVLKRLETDIAIGDRDSDPCFATGEGWIAEEAFATGLLCFLLYPSNPVKALHRAARTCGDSDSIACLTGAFAGAYYGSQEGPTWPPDWHERIEYRTRLLSLSSFLSRTQLRPEPVPSPESLPFYALFTKISQGEWSEAELETLCHDVKAAGDTGIAFLLSVLYQGSERMFPLNLAKRILKGLGIHVWLNELPGPGFGYIFRFPSEDRPVQIVPRQIPEDLSIDYNYEMREIMTVEEWNQAMAEYKEQRTAGTTE